jgi:hypothetical protein
MILVFMEVLAVQNDDFFIFPIENTFDEPRYFLQNELIKTTSVTMVAFINIQILFLTTQNSEKKMQK